MDNGPYFHVKVGVAFLQTQQKKKKHQTSYTVSLETSYNIKLTVFVVIKWTPRMKCRTVNSGGGLII